VVPKTINRIALLNMVLIMEGVLLLIATGWSWLREIPMAAALVPNSRGLLLGTASGIALSISGAGIYWMSKFKLFKWLVGIRELITKELAPLFSTITLPDVFLVAVTSGFCEEIFFRGVLQQQFGILSASIMFGFLHSPSLRYPQYGIWAFVAGLFLGWLYDYTGNLWAPIVAHVVNNILGLLLLRYISRSAATNSETDKKQI
jgi:membrane protease YdiL (CAAX protease family)